MKKTIFSNRGQRVLLSIAAATLGAAGLALLVGLGPKTLGTGATMLVRDEVTPADFSKAATLAGVDSLNDSGPIALALSHFGLNRAADAEERVSLEVAPGWLILEELGGGGAQLGWTWGASRHVKRVCEEAGALAQVTLEMATNFYVGGSEAYKALWLTHENGHLFTYYKRTVREGERASLGLLKDAHDSQKAVLETYPGLLAPCPEVGAAEAFEKTFELVSQGQELRAWGQDREGRVGLPQNPAPPLQGQKSFFISKSFSQIQFETAADARAKFEQLEVALQRLQPPSRTEHSEYRSYPNVKKEVIRRFATGQVMAHLETRRQDYRVRLAWADPDVAGFTEPNEPLSPSTSGVAQSPPPFKWR